MTHVDQHEERVRRSSEALAIRDKHASEREYLVALSAGAEAQPSAEHPSDSLSFDDLLSRPLREERDLWKTPASNAVSSPAYGIVEAIRAGLAPELKEAVKSKLWPTLVQQATDAHHDERTEGYARRPFRINHHD